MVGALANGRTMKRGAIWALILAVVYSAIRGEEPTTLTAKVGEYVVFDCDIDFPQDIIIPHVLQWRKDNELIFSWTNNVPEYNENFVNRINLLSDTDAWQRGRGSINVTSIRETDEGWYECKVIFPNRTPSSKPNGTWFHLQVEGGSFIAVPPVNETRRENDSVELKCVSKISAAAVTWYKDGTPVYDLDEMRDRVQVLPEGSLYVMGTDMKDSGYYSCEVTDDEGEKQTAGAYLNVQFKAKVVHAPRRVYLPFGKPGDLECYYRANPEITKIRWEKDGFLFDAYNVPGVFARKNGSLYFSKVDDSHGGEYTCTPYNDLGTGGPSPRMQVIVQRAPVFTVTPHVLYLRKIGEAVSMHCEAADGEGIDQPAIIWSKRNGEIPQNRSTVAGGNLTIINIQLSDRGSYQCMAKNEAATIASEAELLVEETVRTQAPYNVTTDVTKNSVTVKWLAAYGKPKLKFSVWYRCDNSQDWRMIELNSNMYEAKIADLVPGETYDVMVLSQNEQGDGMFSKTVRITTKDEEPLIDETEGEEVDREFRSPVGLYQQIGPPTDLYVQIVDDGYKVMWKPPKHGLEMLRYYTVLWYKDPSEERVGAAETVADNVILKKPFIIGAAGGALLVTIIIAAIWYFINPSGRTFIT